MIAAETAKKIGESKVRSVLYAADLIIYGRQSAPLEIHLNLC